MFGELKDLEADRRTLTSHSNESDPAPPMTASDAEQYLLDLTRSPLYTDRRKAEEVLRALSAAAHYEEGRLLHISPCSAIQVFRRFGHGLYFLFNGKLHFLWLLALLAFASLPFVINNSLGTGAVQALGAASWLLPSVANAPSWALPEESLAAFEQGKLELTRRYMLAQNQLINSARAMQLAWDAGFVGALILAWLLLQYAAFREWILVERDVVSLSKFGLRVSNLPSQPFTKEELLGFFQTAFQEQIVAVSFGYNIAEVFPIAIRIEQLIRELDRLKAENLHSGDFAPQIQALESRIVAEREKVPLQLRNLSSLNDNVSVPLDKLEAFLVFEESVVPKLLADLFREDRAVAHIQKLASENEGFSKFASLKVSLPDDPGSLRFEHLGLRASQQSPEVAKTVVIALLLCALSVAVFLVIEGGLKTLKPNFRCGGSAAGSRGNRLYVRNDFSDEEYACYCRANGGSGASAAAAVFCAGHRAKAEAFFGLMALPTVFLLLANTTIAWFVDWASRKFRFYSGTNRFAAGVAIAATFTSLNTLLCLVLSSDFFVGFPEDGSGLPPPFQPRSGLWLVEFCNKAMWLAILLALAPQLGLVLSQLAARWARDRRAAKALWQEQYIRQRLPAEFPLLAQYALLFTLVFFVILFSGVAPLLCVFCFLALLGLYWAEKFVLAALCRKPPALRELPVRAFLRWWVPLAILLRLVLSIVVNSLAFVTFDSKDLYALRSLEDLRALFDAASSGKTALRNSLPLAVILLGFILVLILEDFACRGLGRAHRQNLLTRSASNAAFRESQKTIALHAAPSYDLFQLPRYRTVFKTPLQNPEELLLQNINANFGSFDVSNLRISKLAEEKIDADMEDLLRKFSKDGTITEVAEQDVLVPVDTSKDTRKPALSVIPEVNEDLYQSSFRFEEGPVEQPVGEIYTRLRSKENSPPVSGRSSLESLKKDP